MKQPPQGDEDFSSKPKKDREAVEHRYRLVDLEMAKQLLGKDHAYPRRLTPDAGNPSELKNSGF